MHATTKQIAKRVRVRATEGGAGDALSFYADLGAFTPSFLWLLRDFYFDMNEGGRTVRGSGGC
jgi:hypothetical protein